MMQSMLIASFLAVAGAASVPLTTFDGAAGTTQRWKAMNDPVMGGKSKATFVVDSNAGVFDGAVAIVPSLKAPGFCSMQSPRVTFPDISGADAIELVARQTSDYKGWRFVIGDAPRDPTSGAPFFVKGSYKANFAVPVSKEFQTITIPFTDFTYKWSDTTGEPKVKCADDASVCPDAKHLETPKLLEITAEGVEGSFHLEVKSISAVNTKSKERAEFPWPNRGSDCPPVEVQENFNLTEWIRASWYMQKQQVNGYQPEERLFCVVATYNESFKGQVKKVPFFGGSVVTVYNDCNVGKTNGPASHNYTDPDFKAEFASPLCARVANKKEPAKLEVAPCALPNIFAGNYWVVAAGPSPDNYEYGIIIAGQPTVKRSDGCTTPSTCTGPSQTGCGLWMVTRKRMADKATVAMLEDLMHKKGISTQDLKTIDHTGCKYEGYAIKPNDRQGREGVLDTMQKEWSSISGMLEADASQAEAESQWMRPQTEVSAGVTLATFDGAEGTTFKFSELNDPVMGGRSTGTFKVDTANKVGVFDGEVVDVPSLKAPGFIKVAGDAKYFPDASSVGEKGDVVLTLRSSQPDYKGYRVTVVSGAVNAGFACAGGGAIIGSRGCYKAKFSVPQSSNGEFQTVRVPLSSFSDLWSSATGEHTKECADDASACLTSKKLAKIQRLELWAEGVAGKANLEVKKISIEAESMVLV